MACQPIRVGIVGAGRMGRIRALSAHAHPLCKVVHVADVVASNAQALAAEVGCTASSDWEPLVARSDVDAIVVATPHKYLSPITVAALQAGKYVFCEKPMARRLDEAELILRTATGAVSNSHPVSADSFNTSNSVIVGYTLRHHPAVVRAKELVAEGAIGEPFYVRGRYGHGGRSGYEKEWRGSVDLSGGGVLLDLGVHLIDLSRWFLGEFQRATGFMNSYFWATDSVRNLPPIASANMCSDSNPEPSVEDNAFMMLMTDTQKIAFLHASWTEWKNTFSFEIVGQKGFLAVEGRGGNYGPERLRVGLRRFAGDVPQIEEISFAESLESGGVGRTQGMNGRRDRKDDGQKCDPALSSYWAAEWSAFVEAMQCARSQRINSRDGHSANMFDARQNLEIVNAVYQSARCGGVVSLEPAPMRTAVAQASACATRIVHSLFSMNQKSASAKLLRNTLFNGFGKLAGYLSVLILSPIILSRLGAGRFALWAIVMLFAGQFGLLDLGFSTVLTKYVAEFNTSHQLELANPLFTAALCCYALISATLLVVLWHFRVPVFRFFSVPEGFWSEWNYLIPGMVLIFFLTSALGVLQSVLNGMQEMAIPNAAAVLQGGCMVALTLALLRAGFGLRGVVLAAVLSLLTAFVFLSFFVIRLVPSLRLAPFIGAAGFLPALRFGATVQLSKISAVAVAYGDRILISHFLGLILLAKYQLAYTVINAMRGAALLLVSAVVPAASDLAARSDRSNLQNLYWRGTKYTVLTCLALGSSIMVLAPVITRAWLGHDDGVISLVIRVLAAGQLFHITTGLGTSMCEGMGLVALEAKFCVCLTVLQTAIGIPAVRHFGLFGLLTSTALVTAGTSVVFLHQFHRSMQSERHFSWPSLLFTPVTAAALASCVVLGISAFFLVSWQSRSSYATLLLFQAALFMATYLLFVLRSNYLDARDLQLASRLPGGALWTALLSRGER